MQTVTSDDFQQEVLKSEIPVLVDFWATWCPPCRNLTPILEDLANDANGRFKIVKVDIDESPDLADTYQVSAIPLLLIIKNGQIIKRLLGLHAKEKLVEALTDL